MNGEDRHILQNVMDDVHSQFIEAVAAGRSLDIKEVRALADGRIFTGRQAKTAKLVDELGDLNDAIKLAADMGGIEGEPRVVEPRKRFSIRDFIEGRFGGILPNLQLETGIRLKYLMAF
jgi:protease-4